METAKTFQALQKEVITKNKNGVNFILAASVCWLLITTVWLLPYSDEKRALFTFFCTAPLMPFAWIFSRIFKTSWKIEDNPLNQLGLWLNFAQLFYFPFIFIFFDQNPAQMVMAFAIITGAHFFPYAWFYKTKAYAILAGIISLGASLIGTQVSENPSLIIAGFMTSCLLILSVWIFADYKKIHKL